jgi:hypothetical protein
MMDQPNIQAFAHIYRLLVQVLQRESTGDGPEQHVSYRMGDLTGRVLLGTKHVPPDELLEAAARILRSGTPEERHRFAARLEEQARYLDQLLDRP